MSSICRMPNLFLLGVQKAGTTMLYDIFKNHPDIYLPDNKEPHYFSNNKYFEKGIDYYRQYYKNVNNQKYVADFTPDYLFWPHALDRMQGLVDKNTKYIVSLRQPLSRAYSQYNMMVSRGFYMNGFENDLENEIIEIENPSQKNLLRPAHMIARGLYSHQLKRLFRRVSKNQVKIIIFEEWINNKENVVQEIETFLGVSHESNIFESNQVSNPTLLYPSNPLVKRMKAINQILLKSTLANNKLFNRLKEKVKQRLGKKPERLKSEEFAKLTKKYFLEDIKECEKLLKRDLSIWY